MVNLCIDRFEELVVFRQQGSIRKRLLGEMIIHTRLPRECALVSGKSYIPFPARQAARDWNHAQLKRLPRECGGPVDDKFHEVVNSYAGYVIDLCEGLFVHWIPAFARKSLGERRFIQLMLYTLNRAFRTVVSLRWDDDGCWDGPYLWGI